MNRTFSKTAKALLALTLILAMLLPTACVRPAENDAPEETAAPATAKPLTGKTENLTAGMEPGRVNERKIDARFIAAQTEFAVELFKNALEKGENSLISPLSAMIALSMAANGADGKTLSEMEKALGGIPIDELNEYLLTYVENLPSGENAKLIPANAAFIRNDFPVGEGFLRSCADYYKMEVFSAPFTADTVRDINNWAKEHTDGRIDRIIETLDPQAVMVLLNALLFDAKWTEPYFDYQVENGVFHAMNGEERTVRMMRSAEYSLLENEDSIGFIKPYDNGQYAFAALMPDEGTDIYDYIASLTGEKLRASLEPEEGFKAYAALPRFSFDYSTSLVRALREMGMNVAFSSEGEADFTRIGGERGDVYIGEVLQNTHIEVTEYGTVAAAVTAIEFLCGSALVETKEVTLDRPFVFMILDTATNIPLFIGVVTDVR